MNSLRYNPPRFDLFEFDDEDLRSARQVRRWFVGWNGLANEPAEEVILAWSAPDAGVLVATSERSYDLAEARLSAAHLALAGDALPIPARPDSPGTRHREIERIASTESLWSVGTALAAGSPSADVAMCDGFAVAHGHVDGMTVLVAAAGVLPDQFRVRRVRRWDAYGLDATKSYPVSELNRLAGYSGD
jgi:hypothetical protein